MKRQNYITWDEYFMGLAILSTYHRLDEAGVKYRKYELTNRQININL